MRKSKLFRKIGEKLGLRVKEKIELGYQDTRFPEDQFELISKRIETMRVDSIFEAGCNQGLLLRRFKLQDKFCVGLDLDTYWESSTKNAALGVYKVDEDLIKKLPNFDCVLLLSVHHQLVRFWGEEKAKHAVKSLYERSNQIFFIEFSARAKKYGYEMNSCFLDNDPKSILEYAHSWLDSAGIHGAEFLGTTRENPPKEPYRYLFCAERKREST